MIFSKKTSQMDKKLSLMGVIRPVYLVLLLFGLFPYSLKSTRNLGVVIKRKSIYFNSVCGVSVIILIYSFYALHIQNVFARTESNTMTEVLMTKMNYMIELTNFVIFCTVAYVCAFQNRLTYAKLLNAIASSCLNFSDLSRNIIFGNIQRHVRLVISLLCFLLAMQLVVNFTRNDSVWKIILVTLSFIFPQTIQFAVISFYCVLLFAVSAILKNIDKKTGDLAKVKPVHSSWFKLEIKPSKLRQLEVAYVKASVIKREINRVFRACLLVSIFQCFHSLVSEAHIIFDGVTSNEHFTTHDICNCSIWILYQLMKIYAISYSGALLQEKEVNIGRSLCNIPIGPQDTRLYMEIQHFSSLMSHQTTELNVYGYFVLDAKLMFNVIASATMYLIILVQFGKKT